VLSQGRCFFSLKTNKQTKKVLLDGLTEVCFLFVVLKPPVRGRKKRREE
jgi:hypothetical protein